MTAIDTTGAERLFASMQANSGQLEYYAGRALERGIELYRDKQYGAAVGEFRMSLSLAPQAQNALGAAELMSKAYRAMGDAQRAVDSVRDFVGRNRAADGAHALLARLLFQEERYDEAVAEYEKAVELNPTASNRFALGEAYLQTGRYNDAEQQFMQVRLMLPDDPAAHLGLGQTYARQGDTEAAVREFKAAIDRKRDFWDAYAELGYVYADRGEIDLAQDLVGLLEEKAPALADILSRYVYKADPPKFVLAYADSSFPYSLPAKTAVSSLDAGLSAAGASKTFYVKFQFDKEMDRESVETTTNWAIRRSQGGAAGLYNYGLPVPSTEITVSMLPDYVFYDSRNLTATVFFTIRQNASADGTLDPGHIEFSFRGTDRFGQTMDPAKDQYTGFSGVY